MQIFKIVETLIFNDKPKNMQLTRKPKVLKRKVAEKQCAMIIVIKHEEAQ